jgi:hypothetical protein
MKLRDHLILAGLCILLWAVFYILGRPYDYFMNFSRELKLVLILSTLFGIIPVIAIITLSLIQVPYVRASVWFAFYGSVPLFVLDYITVGLIGSEGIQFLASHWFLTLGYIAVWGVFPLIGKALETLSLKILKQKF